MKRFIRFSKFRNIGLDTPEYLVLNNDFQKGKMGNLLILIGSNNSGKSNILAGVRKISAERLEQRDITTLSYDDKDRNPSVALCYSEDSFKAEYVLDIAKKGSWNIEKTKQPIKHVEIKKETLLKELNQIRNIFYNYDMNDAYLAMELDNLIQKLTNEDDTQYSYSTHRQQINAIISKCSVVSPRSYNDNHHLIWNAIQSSGLSIYQDWLESGTCADKEVLKDILPDHTNAIPAIHEYHEEPLKNSDLYVENINQLSNSRFFTSLFKAMNIDAAQIQHAYTRFHSSNNVAILTKLQKDLDKKIQTLNNLFNKMYFATNDQYRFTLVFESSRILFGMARGKDDDAIDLDYQSTGFRWFFNLFFNFLSTNSLNPGDIVIMDEPATNLHPQGQAELRKFIKNYAVKNDVLFIIATHSPFMIDTDNYDELRVVSLNNNRCSIDNMFTAVNTNDPDTLLPIKESLTIKQNVFYDLDTEIVWVEGITDYNYLTMLKNLLGIKNIAFLPFNGVGTNSSQAKDILTRLLSVKFHKKSLLVDADKAGMEMFKLAKNSDFVSVHNLSEIHADAETGKPVKTIEDLFSKEDKQKYPVIMEKKALGASELKIHAKLEDFSESTISNFKKLFELLQE